ncbi:Uncharacterized protein DAT39_002844, partial [Clarias magur]
PQPKNHIGKSFHPNQVLQMHQPGICVKNLFPVSFLDSIWMWATSGKDVNLLVHLQHW